MQKKRQWLLSGIWVALCVAALTPVAAMADPAITGFSANNVPLNSIVLIYGSDLGAAQGSGTVLVGTHFVPVLAWSPTAITVFLNPLAYGQSAIVLDAAYPVQITRADGKKCNVLNLTITSSPPFVYTPSVVDQLTRSDQPTVGGFQTPAFDKDDVVAISGSGFGDSQGTGYVSVKVTYKDATNAQRIVEVAVPVLAWSENAINVLLQLPTLPAGARDVTYQVIVHRSNGKTDTHAISSATMTPTTTRTDAGRALLSDPEPWPVLLECHWGDCLHMVHSPRSRSSLPG